MSIAIRRAVPDDAAAILQINAAFDDARATVDHIAAHIRARSQFETPFVAEVAGRVVGLACLRLLPCLCDPVPYAELTELIVDPLYRRRGAGRALVRKIESEARAQGAATLVLMTAPDNSTAQAFYQALGYRRSTINLQRSLVESP